MDGTRTYSASASFAYTPTEPGAYRALGWVKDGSEKIYAYSATTEVVEKLAVASVTPDKAEAAVGETISWTVAATGGAGGYRYYFDVLKDGARVAGSSAYGAAASYDYAPSEAGAYTVRAWVRDAKGAKAYLVSAATVVTAGSPLVIRSVTADRTELVMWDLDLVIWVDVTWTIDAEGGEGPLTYFFELLDERGRVISRTIGYGDANAYTCGISSDAQGVYTMRGYVKDASGAKATKLSDGLTVRLHPGVSVSPFEGDFAQGDTIGWDVFCWGGYVADDGDYAVRYDLQRDGTSVAHSDGYMPLGDFGAYDSEEGVYRFTYPADAAGVYTLRLDVKDARGDTVSGAGSICVGASSAKLTGFVGFDTWYGWTLGMEAYVNAWAMGGAEPYMYRCEVYRDGLKTGDSGEYERSDFSSWEFGFVFDAPGEYQVKITVKDAAGRTASAWSDAHTVTEAPLKVEISRMYVRDSYDTRTCGVGDRAEWDYYISGGAYRGTGARYACRSELYRNGALYSGSDGFTAFDYTEGHSAFTPTETGAYQLKVYVRDADGTIASALSDTLYVQSDPLRIRAIETGASPTAGQPLSVTIQTNGGTGAVTYRVEIVQHNTSNLLYTTNGYVASPTFCFTPGEMGEYTGEYGVRCWVKDASGATAFRELYISTD